MTKGNIVKIKLLAFLRSGAKGKRVGMHFIQNPILKKGEKRKKRNPKIFIK